MCLVEKRNQETWVHAQVPCHTVHQWPRSLALLVLVHHIREVRRAKLPRASKSVVVERVHQILRVTLHPSCAVNSVPWQPLQVWHRFKKNLRRDKA